MSTAADPRRPAVQPAALAAIASRVDERVGRLLDGELARWGSVDPDLCEPLAALRTLVAAGGKRLRPAFCYWAFVGAGGSPDDPAAVDAGAAIELLHAFALIHDDVMDGSATRRGVDAVHVVFGDRHHRQGWRGEARRFGEGAAVLVGDLAFVYADLLVRGAPAEALHVFGELRLEVNMGQYLDLLGTVRGATDRESARRICHYKSGKYTVERPLHLGAALAGRLDDLGPSLTAFGMPLGEAFQLRDDLLGAFGDAASTGKPVGDDLREGKPTVLFALAAERAAGDPASTGVLARYGAADFGADDVTALQDVFVATGAVDEVEASIDALAAESLDALSRSGLTDEAQAALADLARFVAGRDR